LTDSFVDGCLCNVVPTPGAALITNPDQDRGATEDIALIGPLMESDQLGSLNQSAGFTKVTYLHTIFVGHAWFGKLVLSLVSVCELSHIEEPKLLVDFAVGHSLALGVGHSMRMSVVGQTKPGPLLPRHKMQLLLGFHAPAGLSLATREGLRLAAGEAT
jgi:hypothetical protein